MASPSPLRRLVARAASVASPPGASSASSAFRIAETLTILSLRLKYFLGRSLTLQSQPAAGCRECRPSANRPRVSWGRGWCALDRTRGLALARWLIASMVRCC